MAGALTARFEWLSFYYIAKDEKGLVTKERMRQMYDGSLWMQLDAEATKRRGREAPRGSLRAPSLPPPLRPLSAPVVYAYRVVRSYPHDPGCFTQGLLVSCCVPRRCAPA